MVKFTPFVMSEIAKYLKRQAVDTFKLGLEIIEISLFFVILFICSMFEFLFHDTFSVVYIVLDTFVLFLPLFLIARNIRYFNELYKYFTQHPVRSSGFAFLLILILPLIISSLLAEGSERHTMVRNGLLAFSTFSLIFNAVLDTMVFQIKIIRSAIVDVILEKRATEKKDILVIITTYSNIILIFTLLYLLMQALSDGGAFKSIMVPRTDVSASLYLALIDCFYYSVITISTLGYGDIYPTAWYSKLIVIVEVVTGLSLLTFSLGIILSGRNPEDPRVGKLFAILTKVTQAGKANPRRKPGRRHKP